MLGNFFNFILDSHLFKAWKNCKYSVSIWVGWYRQWIRKAHAWRFVGATCDWWLAKRCWSVVMMTNCRNFQTWRLISKTSIHKKHRHSKTRQKKHFLTSSPGLQEDPRHNYLDGVVQDNYLEIAKDFTRFSIFLTSAKSWTSTRIKLKRHWVVREQFRLWFTFSWVLFANLIQPSLLASFVLEPHLEAWNRCKIQSNFEYFFNLAIRSTGKTQFWDRSETNDSPLTLSHMSRPQKDWKMSTFALPKISSGFPTATVTLVLTESKKGKIETSFLASKVSS